MGLEPEGAEVVIDLEGVDADDPRQVARAVDQIRAAARAHRRVRVLGCPQVVAHTLYRVGALAGGRIELAELRERLAEP